MSTGKLTVQNCNPSVAVIIPSYPVDGFPGDAEIGAIAWGTTAASLYVFAPVDTGGAIWQKLQRQ